MRNRAGSTRFDRFKIEIRHPFKKPSACGDRYRNNMQPQFINQACQMIFRNFDSGLQ